MMKSIKFVLFTILFFGFLINGNAQTLNLKTIDSTKHIFHLGVGLDYSFSYALGYTRKLNSKTPIIIHANFSIPAGENLLDDFKTKIGGQFVLINQSRLKASLALSGIYRTYKSPLVTLQNFGSEAKGVIGYYRPKWFIAGELGFDKAIVTHFKHSALFKETIYQDVKDGWYEPSTGGNLSYGLQTGYSFKKSDLTLNIGKITTENIETTPLFPIYLMFGYNFRFH